MSECSDEAPLISASWDRPAGNIREALEALSARALAQVGWPPVLEIVLPPMSKEE